MGRGMKAGKRPKTGGGGGGGRKSQMAQMQQMQAVQRQMEQMQAELDSPATLISGLLQGKAAFWACKLLVPFLFSCLEEKVASSRGGGRGCWVLGVVWGRQADQLLACCSA